MLENLEENTCGNYTFMRIEKEWGLGQSYTIRHFHRWSDIFGTVFTLLHWKGLNWENDGHQNVGSLKCKGDWVQMSFKMVSNARKRLSLSFFFNLILFLNFTILYWFCHISKWIRHRHMCVPHPEPSSLLPPHTIPLRHPSAPAPSIQYRASNLDWLSLQICSMA